MSAKKVLLADDDLDDQYLFHDFLQDHSQIFLMPMVGNGVELIETLDSIEDNTNLPDFIILDQNMPKRNGLQTLEILKQNDRYLHIPVMVYSTYIDEQLKNSYKAMGASVIITKPFTREGYFKMIDKFLDSISKQ